MEAPNSAKKPGGGWILFCRLFVCGIGAFFVGGTIYDYYKYVHHWSSGLIFLAVFGLLLICLGIFTSAKTCEKIADGITCGF